MRRRFSFATFNNHNNVVINIRNKMFTWSSISAIRGLITMVHALSLWASAGRNIQMLLPEPVAILTYVSCPCNTDRTAASCPGRKLWYPKYFWSADGNLPCTSHTSLHTKPGLLGVPLAYRQVWLHSSAIAHIVVEFGAFAIRWLAMPARGIP